MLVAKTGFSTHPCRRCMNMPARHINFPTPHGKLVYPMRALLVRCTHRPASTPRRIFGTSAPLLRTPTPKGTVLEIDGIRQYFDNIFLRDACDCARCIHPETQQKLFQTTDIPDKIHPTSITRLHDGAVRIEWANDIEEESCSRVSHYSTYSPRFLRNYTGLREAVRARYDDRRQILWTRKTMESKDLWINYSDYISSDDSLWSALKHISLYGLVFIREVPLLPDHSAVEKVAARIGNIKDTFYGKTWDVKNMPNSKNIAYASPGTIFCYANTREADILH